MPRDPNFYKEKIQSDLKKYLRKQKNEEIDAIFRMSNIPIKEEYRDVVLMALKQYSDECNLRGSCYRCPFGTEMSNMCLYGYTTKDSMMRYIERLDDIKAENKENRINSLIDKFFSDIGVVSSRKNRDELRRMINEAVAHILEENEEGIEC